MKKEIKIAGITIGAVTAVFMTARKRKKIKSNELDIKELKNFARDMQEVHNNLADYADKISARQDGIDEEMEYVSEILSNICSYDEE